jgi:hypothetical protein
MAVKEAERVRKPKLPKKKILKRRYKRKKS